MTYSDAFAATRSFASRGWLWPIVLVVAVMVAYAPTFITLAEGPWQTEQEGHGPLIIAAALWLVWQSRGKLRAAKISPAPITGWLVLLSGLAVLVLARNQDIWFLEVASEIPVIAGCVLLRAGWEVMRIVAFPTFIARATAAFVRRREKPFWDRSVPIGRFASSSTAATTGGAT